MLRNCDVQKQPIFLTSITNLIQTTFSSSVAAQAGSSTMMEDNDEGVLWLLDLALKKQEGLQDWIGYQKTRCLPFPQKANLLCKFEENYRASLKRTSWWYQTLMETHLSHYDLPNNSGRERWKKVELAKNKHTFFVGEAQLSELGMPFDFERGDPLGFQRGRLVRAGMLILRETDNLWC